MRIASAPELTANRLAGGFTAVASSNYSTVGFSLVNTASSVPATIAPVTAGRTLRLALATASALVVIAIIVALSTYAARGNEQLVWMLARGA